ncbi:hypothetical protein GH733_000533 [Mirounga leonina]|nr:hypothetical protein GH733_000533 [Mirounga leonina]
MAVGKIAAIKVKVKKRCAVKTDLDEDISTLKPRFWGDVEVTMTQDIISRVGVRIRNTVNYFTRIFLQFFNLYDQETFKGEEEMDIFKTGMMVPTRRMMHLPVRLRLLNTASSETSFSSQVSKPDKRIFNPNHHKLGSYHLFNNQAQSKRPSPVSEICPIR